VGTWQRGFPPLFGRKWFTMRSAHHARLATVPEHVGGEGRGIRAHSDMFRGLNFGLSVFFVLCFTGDVGE
jgi:hypothetical protein